MADLDKGNEDLNALLDDALSDLLEGEDEHKTKQSSITVLKTPQPKQGSSKGHGNKGNKWRKRTDVVDEEEMNRFFANMTEQLRAELPKIDPEEAQARINESVPQLFDLMQNLLSKELLYPALKDLEPKFEEWLKKNSDTLSQEDEQRYKDQIGKIHDIIQVFDDESLSDNERFEKNLELMEQMQSLGAPPSELTVPEGMSKCAIM